MACRGMFCPGMFCPTFFAIGCPSIGYLVMAEDRKSDGRADNTKTISIRL